MLTLALGDNVLIAVIFDDFWHKIEIKILVF